MPRSSYQAWAKRMADRARSAPKYVKLNRKPLLDGDLAGHIPCIISISRGGRVVVLVPANRLNDVPKSCGWKVQADMFVENNFVNNTALLTRGGVIYSWSQETL